MKKRIQLKESDIKRMVMEALSELTAQNAFDASDLAGQRAKEAEDAGNFDLANRKRAQRNNFMRLGLDKEDHPDRPVVHAPKGFKWSQDAQNQEEPSNSEPSFDDDLNARKQLTALLQQHKSVQARLQDWVNSVKNKNAEDAFNNSRFSTDDDVMASDDNISGDTFSPESFTDDNAFSYETDFSDVKALQTPEYWALQKSCMDSVENGRGIFTEFDIRKLAARTYYELTQTEDYISQSQFEQQVPEEDRGSYTFVPKRGYIQMINAQQYEGLPDNDKKSWAPYTKQRNGETIYRRMRPKYDGMGNMVTANVSPEQIEEELGEIMSYAFNNGNVLKFAFVIINSKHPFESFKTCIKQAAVHYLRKFKKDYFLQTEDSTMDGNGDEENGGGRVPEELMSNSFGSAGGDSSHAARQALSTIKEMLEFVLNDDFNGDINNFANSMDRGKVRTAESMKTAIRIILDNFNTVFNTKIIDRFSDLISTETRNGESTVYKTSSQAGMEFIKSRIAGFITRTYIHEVDENEENVTVKERRLTDPNTGQRYRTKEESVTCGDVDFDSLCEPISDMFKIQNGRAVFVGDFQGAAQKMFKKMTPLWSVLGQKHTADGENNQWGRGDEITRRFKDYKRGALKPINNPGAVNEKLIRKIVMETLRRHLRTL